MQRGKQLLKLNISEITTEGKREVGWSGRLRLQVFVMNVASAVLFDVPPSWLTDCGRIELSVLLTPHNSTRWIWCLLTVCHTAVTMNLGFQERENIKRSWKSRNRVLPSVALCVPLSAGSLKWHFCREHADQSSLYNINLWHSHSDFTTHVKPILSYKSKHNEHYNKSAGAITTSTHLYHFTMLPIKVGNLVINSHSNMKS